MEDRWDRVVSALERLAEAQVKTEEEIRKLWEAQTRTEEEIRKLWEALARFEERVTRLETAVERLAEAQARTEERVIQLEERVTRLEIAVERLEAVVERLAEAQARTEERVTRLEEAVERLAEAQARTEERVTRLEEAVERLAEAQARTSEAQERTEDALRQLARQVGGLSETVGGDIEDIAYIVLYDVLKREFGWEVGVLERSWQRWNGKVEEIDVFGRAKDPSQPGRIIWIVGEAKHNLTMREIERFIHQVKRARRHLIGEVFPVCFCYRARPEIQQRLREANIHLVFSYGRLAI